MKYKVGDRVKIRTDLRGDEYYKTENDKLLYCAVDMMLYGGRVATIVQCDYRRDMATYKLDIDEMYHWSASMLEPLAQNKYRIRKSSDCNEN